MALSSYGLISACLWVGLVTTSTLPLSFYRLTKIQMSLRDSDKGTIVSFDRPRNIVLVGKKHSGKTNLLKHLLLMNTIKKKHWKFGIVFTNTKFDKEYTYLPDKYIIEGYDKVAFGDWKKQLIRMKKERMDDTIPPNFMVFDDLVGELRDDRDFTNFICNHRHFNTSVFVSAQYLRKGVPTSLRECMDYAFLFNSKHELTLKALHEAFGQFFRRFKDFRDFFLTNTQEEFVALLYRVHEKEMETAYLQYKSPDVSKIEVKLHF